jgi:hypothetical protein
MNLSKTIMNTSQECQLNRIRERLFITQKQEGRGCRPLKIWRDQFYLPWYGNGEEGSIRVADDDDDDDRNQVSECSASATVKYVGTAHINSGAGQSQFRSRPMLSNDRISTFPQQRSHPRQQYTFPWK